MSKSKALRPCPFCGSTPTLERHPGIVGIVCGNECDQQGLAIAFHPDKEAQAIAHWNRAADRLAALEAENDRLKRDVDGLVELTMGLDEHPDGYDGPCMCKLCQSYLDVDEEALAAGGDQ